MTSAPEPIRPRRLAMIGGGPGSWIGAMHRGAAAA
jgi:hypothetical protein